VTQVYLELLPHLFVVAITAIMLGLFYGINRRVRRLRKQVGNSESSIQAETAQLANSINELKRKFEDWEKDEGMAGASLEPGLTDMARAKVLKMHRVGQAPDQIASKLRLPKGEIDLLIKVHQIVMRPYRDLGTKVSQSQT
jgi:hypothetical protein